MSEVVMSNRTEQLPARHRRPFFFVAMAVVWICFWAMSLTITNLITVGGAWHTTAILFHILSLVVAMGAVLTVDFIGLLWVLKRRPLGEVLSAGRDGQMLIWLGILGLVVSGAFLNPDLSNGLTWVKMLAVLVLGLNGIFVWYLEGHISRRIWMLKHLLFNRDYVEATEFDIMPGRLKVLSTAGTLISQVGWWTAVIIGFLTTRSNIIG